MIIDTDVLKNDIKRIFQKRKKIIIIITIILIIFGYHKYSTRYIKMLRERATIDGFNGYTVGLVFEKAFENGKWKQEGNIVTFTGVDPSDRKYPYVKAVIKIIKNEHRFEVIHCYRWNDEESFEVPPNRFLGSCLGTVLRQKTN